MSFATCAGPGCQTRLESCQDDENNADHLSLDPGRGVDDIVFFCSWECLSRYALERSTVAP